jgi:starch synthase
MVEDLRQKRNIWMLSREYGELAGAGGVKDVASQLAEALARSKSRSVSMVMPCYGFMDAENSGFLTVKDPLKTGSELILHIEMHEPDREIYELVRFYHRDINGVNIYLVDAERFRDKTDVYTYTEEDEKRRSWQKTSQGHHDYFAMNILLQKAALDLMINLGERPDIIHCHDGHTAILPALIRRTSGYGAYFRGSACLVTIHNAGHGYHQEIADNAYARAITGLPESIIAGNQLEEKFDPFLVAGRFALMNTVSENYARELQETASDALTGWLGHALKSRGIRLSGVTNGIDPKLFSPIYAAENETLSFDFAPGDPADDLSGKQRCKAALLQEINERASLAGFECHGNLNRDPDRILFTFVGRLSEQKGVDLLVEVMSGWLKEESEAQLLVLGNGAPSIEQNLLRLTWDAQLRNRVCFLRGYSSVLANKLYTAGDFLVIPSRYEPCGLTDFIAQLFGNIPIVHHVGGLVKVRDGVTGIAYTGNGPEHLLNALQRAKRLYGDPVAKRKMQLDAIREIESRYTWDKVMQEYIVLYDEAKVQRRSEIL